ncbi:MAG: hypothetical protein JWN30_884 [Bacilli bacterium]|nr:hypothetical protein [Bacilli bacterium]
MATELLRLREIPSTERPRERLMSDGPSCLSNCELLSIILQTGADGISVLHLSEQVLATAGSLRKLIDCNMEELMKIKGIGRAKASQLLAAIELGRRLARYPSEEKQVISSPEDVAVRVMDRMRYLNKEHFVLLFLDTKNQIVAEETVSIGSLNASIVHPREVFHAAIKKNAASIIAIHNHPSGDPSPSREDLEVTERLKAAGELLGIPVLDHVIIGDRCYISLKQKGLF